jgi:hypothetical protein
MQYQQDAVLKTNWHIALLQALYQKWIDTCDARADTLIGDNVAEWTNNIIPVHNTVVIHGIYYLKICKFFNNKKITNILYFDF